MKPRIRLLEVSNLVILSISSGAIFLLRCCCLVIVQGILYILRPGNWCDYLAHLLLISYLKKKPPLAVLIYIVQQVLKTDELFRMSL